MSKELTNAKREAIKKYDAANTRQYHLKLNLNTDQDIIEHLAQMAGMDGGMQGYIKKLIRDDMAHNGAAVSYHPE